MQPRKCFFCIFFAMTNIFLTSLAFNFRCSVFKFSVTRYNSFFVVSNKSVLDLFPPPPLPPPPALPGAPPGSPPPRPPVAELWLELSELYSSPLTTGAMFATIGIR